ncbi:MAG: DUF4012 domain-containing protein [Propionicimonas sp.]
MTGSDGTTTPGGSGSPEIDGQDASADSIESAPAGESRAPRRLAEAGRSGSPRTRTRIVLALAATVSCLILLAAAGTFWAKGFYESANEGKAQAVAAMSSLAAGDNTSAASKFDAARVSFARAKALFGPEWLADVAKFIPLAGRQISAADALVTIGVHGSEAGKEFSAILAEMPSSPAKKGSTKPPTISEAARLHLDAGLNSLCAAADQAPDLAEAGLVQPLADVVRSVNSALTPVTSYLKRCDALLEFERYLLSEQRRYLLVSQHPGEIRPTGGFIGSYGILDIGPQGFSIKKYEGIENLPVPRGLHIPSPPGDRLTQWFKLRDANWWIDFPTSARALLLFWHEYGQAPVDGVIAIDTNAMSAVLEVTGPITVTKHDETFTAENLLDRLTYLLETEFIERQIEAGGTLSFKERKAVLTALAHEMTKRVSSGGSKVLTGTAAALAEAADEKHLQFYSPDPAAQAAVTGLGWSGALTAPDGTTDLLAVVNTMDRAAKVNIGVRKTIDYQVALAADGSAETRLTLGYTNTAPYALPPRQRSVFSNYLRVYRPVGTETLPGVGELPEGSVSTLDLGLPTVVRPFQLPRGRSHRETIVTRIPRALGSGEAPPLPQSPTPTRAGSLGWVSHYRLLLVRQADLEDYPTTVTVTIPAGMRITSVNTWKTASGEKLEVSNRDNVVHLERPLDGDTVLDIEMAPIWFGQ